MTTNNSVNLGTFNPTVSSFTPGIAFGGGTTGITYNQQTGFYMQMGNIIFFYGTVWINSKGSSTGNATITGFPVTSGAATNTMFSVFQSGTSPGAGAQLFAFMGASVTTASIFSQGNASGAANATNTTFANGNAFYFSGFYTIN